ncbi:hypothetical protein GC090_22380 (plasmid) [Pantoea sp. JZ29]|nr:hypothetical protein GC090_22380 [Pantoea sp. JZ29]
MMDISIFNRMRKDSGFLTLDELGGLCEAGNIIYDPFSTLIYKDIKIGKGNIFFPNVILAGKNGNTLEIGDSNIFFSNTSIDASAGPVFIGSENQFGEGGFTVKANRTGAVVKIGNHGRYLGGASVFGVSDLQSGSQILGQITVDSCTLESGGDWHEPSPDERAGLLKGFGTARNLNIPRGRVINGAGRFEESGIELQSVYHPVKKA